MYEAVSQEAIQTDELARMDVWTFDERTNMSTKRREAA